VPEDPIKLFASRSERFPEASDEDIAHSVLKAGFGSIVGPAAAIFERFLPSSLERRRTDWFKELADEFDRLNIKVESITNGEAFLSAAVQATQIAIATHRSEKWEMLRNALLNVAAGNGPADDRQEIFIAAIESLSVTHVQVLRFFWKGHGLLMEKGYWNSMNPYAIGNYETAIGKLYPDLTAQPGLLGYVMNDLHNRGFSTVSRPGDTYVSSPTITQMGIDFLNFIQKPQ
jgi:hypothetical protein